MHIPIGSISRYYIPFWFHGKDTLILMTKPGPRHGQHLPAEGREPWPGSRVLTPRMRFQERIKLVLPRECSQTLEASGRYSLTLSTNCMTGRLCARGAEIPKWKRPKVGPHPAHSLLCMDGQSDHFNTGSHGLLFLQPATLCSSLHRFVSALRKSPVAECLL